MKGIWMKKYSRAHIGEMYVTNQGYECRVIDGGSKAAYCTIQIKDWIMETAFGNVKCGRIRYPYHPSFSGVGYLGVGIHQIVKGSKYTKAGGLWSDMLKRCYNLSTQEKHPTYKGVTVASEWHNFQTFAEWFYNTSNYREGWHLDKDLLSGDTKVYSPETCLFIPQALNNFMTNNQKSKGEYPTGVNLSHGKYQASINEHGKQVHIGTFNTPEEASEAYQERREIQAKQQRTKSQDILPEAVLKNIK